MNLPVLLLCIHGYIQLSIYTSSWLAWRMATNQKRYSDLCGGTSSTEMILRINPLKESYHPAMVCYRACCSPDYIFWLVKCFFWTVFNHHETTQTHIRDCYVCRLVKFRFLFVFIHHATSTFFHATLKVSKLFISLVKRWTVEGNTTHGKLGKTITGLSGSGLISTY